MGAPRFEGFAPSTPKSSAIKKALPRTGTTPEIVLRRALYSRGIRYRLNARDLPGRPDIVFRGARLALFCDGDFWHGRDWGRRCARLQAGANPRYWVAKIEANMARDVRHRAELEALGWTVLRFWESDLLNRADDAASKVVAVLDAKRRG